MNKLLEFKLKESEYDACECTECGWTGKFGDCETTTEYDGIYPEGRELLFHLCPTCEDGGCVING